MINHLCQVIMHQIFVKLMLYFPWRQEKQDLLGNHPDYYSNYQTHEDDLLHNEKKYTANVEDFMEFLNNLSVCGPPQHLWSSIAPTSEENQLQAQIEGAE